MTGIGKHPNMSRSITAADTSPVMWCLVFLEKKPDEVASSPNQDFNAGNREESWEKTYAYLAITLKHVVVEVAQL